MSRPVVGITGYIVDSERSQHLGFGPRALDCYAGTYAQWLRDCGLMPLPVPSHPADEHDDYLDMLDGLVLTGGADIDPTRYDEDAHPLAKLEQPRDTFEFGLVHAAIARGLPILGICRGMQVLNVALGGSMHQHLPDRSAELIHSSEYRDGRRHPDDMWRPAHHTITIIDPELADLAGRVVTSNSYHHQGVARLGHGVRVAARADDGLVEAIVGEELPILGVQWHPEMHDLSEEAGTAPFTWLHRRLAPVPVTGEALAAR